MSISPASPTHFEALYRLLQEVAAFDAQAALSSGEIAFDAGLQGQFEFSGFRSLDSVYRTITEASARFCGAAAAEIWLLNTSGDSLVCADRFEVAQSAHTRLPAQRSFEWAGLLQRLEQGRPFSCAAFGDCPRTGEIAEARGALFLPVAGDRGLAGFLTLTDEADTRVWSDEQVLVAGTLAAQVAIIDGKVARSRAGVVGRLHTELLRMVVETTHVIPWELNTLVGTIDIANFSEHVLGPAPEGGSYPSFHDLVHPADYEGLMTQARAALESGEGFVASFRLIRTDGELRWMIARGDPVSGRTEGTRRLIGIAVDVHERKLTELQAERLLRQQRALLDNLPDMAWAKDLHGRFTAVNRAFAAALGCEPSEMIGKRDEDFFAPGVAGEMVSDDAEATEGGKTVRSDRQVELGGGRVWLELIKSPVLDRSGSAIGSVGVARDITARKAVEQQLSENEQRFRAFAELCADWYWRTDAEGRLVELTGSALGRLPYEPREALGRRYWELPGVDPDPRSWTTLRDDVEARRAYRDFVFRRMTAHGGEHWYMTSGLPVTDAAGRHLGYHGVGRDITGRMHTAEQLRIAHERLDRALGAANLTTWDLDLKTGRVLLSESWRRLNGFPDSELSLSLQELRALVHPDDVPVAEAAFLSAIAPDSGRYEVEHRVRTADGSYRWLLSRGEVILRDAAGNALAMSGTNLDIDERHAMQEAVHAALKEQAMLLETCPTGLAIVRDGVLLRCNPAVVRLLGYAPGELEGMPIELVFNAEGEHPIGERLSEKEGLLPVEEKELLRKDGSRVWSLVSVYVLNPATRYAICSLVDIVAQRDVAESLRKDKERADASNRAKSSLLAVTSHEIRTPMNGVLGLLEVLEMSGLDPDQHGLLTSIREATGGLLGLVDQLIDFSRMEAGHLQLQPELSSVHDIVSQSAGLFRGLAGRKGIVIETAFDPALALSHRTDGKRIRQVLHNLLSNAVKFSEAGIISVRAQVSGAEHGYEDVRFTVEDSGPGIPEEDRSRLFMPFVQAGPGRGGRYGGSGLGLAICKRIVDAMGGSVSLERAPGGGTRAVFVLRLPVAAGRTPQPGRSDIGNQANAA